MSLRVLVCTRECNIHRKDAFVRLIRAISACGCRKHANFYSSCIIMRKVTSIPFTSPNSSIAEDTLSNNRLSSSAGQNQIHWIFQQQVETSSSTCSTCIEQVFPQTAAGQPVRATFSGFFDRSCRRVSVFTDCISLTPTASS